MNSHETILKKFYAGLAKLEFKGILADAAPNVTFQIPGKGKLAGKYDAKTFESDLGAKMRELGGENFSFELHELMTSDRHAMVLGTVKLTRKGKAHEYRTAHVWRIEGGKPLAGYEYPRDLYQYDAIWE
jgi:ketosteroid isomerase-like protein